MKCLIQLLSIFLMPKVIYAEVRVDPLVRINQGLVRGQKASDGNYAAFFGIPYAKVDTDNPFGPALPPENFQDIFNADDSSITCPSLNMAIPPMRNDEQNVDCLRLNIFVPENANSQNLLPVLVSIHGGGFDGGSAKTSGVTKFMENGIILVAIHYRLGVYGFMCLDVPQVPGNRGLKDQHEALQWVRDNIIAFGGNPDDVTIAGESAGSCSVLLHLFSPKEKLFNKVIAESGTPQTDGMFVNADVHAAINLANYFDFNTTDTNEALVFLSNIAPTDLITASTQIKLDLKPCEELYFEGIDRFIDNNPFSLTNNKKIKNTPIIIGHTSKEEMKTGEYVFSDVYSGDPFYDKLSDNFNLREEELIKLGKVVRHFYIGDETISERVTSELEDFNSDFHFNYPVQRMIELLLEESANPIFQYVFSYVGDTKALGAPHISEMKYLFSSSNTTNEDDKILQDRITTLWSNFVKYGNPTPESTDLLPVIWTPVTVDTRPYLDIDVNLEVKDRVFKNRMAFWDLFYSVYLDYNHLIHKTK